MCEYVCELSCLPVATNLELFLGGVVLALLMEFADYETDENPGTMCSRIQKRTDTGALISSHPCRRGLFAAN